MKSSDIPMYEKYKLTESGDIEGSLQIPKGWCCQKICRYADGYVYRVLRECTMQGEPLWKCYLIFYSVKCKAIFRTDIFEQIKIHMTDFEHGTAYAVGFEFKVGKKWHMYCCKNEVITDKDVLLLNAG